MLIIPAEPALKRRCVLRSVRPPRIALTGFGPFPGVTFNATAQLIAELRDMELQIRPRPRLLTAILPTDWRLAAPQLHAFLADGEPDIALHFGVSSRARGFVIETMAFNETAQRLDCAGAPPRERCVRRSAAAKLRVTIPAQRLMHRLRSAGLTAHLSSDPGRYLCNAVLFESLIAARAAKPPRLAGFVHIPTLGRPEENVETDRFGWRELRTGAAIILAALARTAPKGG